jgi:hypothetical protein
MRLYQQRPEWQIGRFSFGTLAQVTRWVPSMPRVPMTTPEKIMARRHRHRQILDDETIEPRELHVPQHKVAWLGFFIARLAGAIRNIGGRK